MATWRGSCEDAPLVLINDLDPEGVTNEDAGGST